MASKSGVIAAALAMVLTVSGGAWGQTKPALVIADFEGDAKPIEGGVLAGEHATHGKGSLKLEAKQAAKATTKAGLPEDWSGYDLVKFDAFNPGQEPVQLTIEIDDAMGAGYWARHNRFVGLAPGANLVEFPIADLWRGEVLRRDLGGFLDPTKIGAFILSSNGTVVIDHLRLEQAAVPKVQVPGLKAFDVGKSGTPVFSGFTPLTEKDAYSKDKGFGWTKLTPGRMEDRMHPDNLFRDWIACVDSELAIDLPDGKYTVVLQIDDPGYWEYMQNYTRRTVSAESKVVIDQTMDADAFKQNFFRNQDAEDLPGDDPFEKYVEPRHPWQRFEVQVSDGQLNLSFKSPQAMGITLSAIVLWPADQDPKGQEFMAYLKSMRKFDWSQRWKPAVKPAKPAELAGKLAEAAQRDGFALFASSPDQPFSYTQIPGDSQALAELEITAARGEYEPACFALRAAKDLGKVEVAVSFFKKAGQTLPAGAVDIRVGRYRFRRYAGNQSGLYSIEERELRHFNQTPQDELKVTPDYARRFWITLHVPEDAAPGLYEGTVTIKTQLGGTATVPLKLNVLNLKLPEPEHLFTLYGIGLLPTAYYPEMKAQTQQQAEVMYKDLRAHGINYISDWNAQVTWRDNKAVVTNAEEVDRDAAVRKSLGFRAGPVDGPAGCSLAELAGDGPIRGLPKAQFIQAWHKTLTDFYQARGWPKPFFCYGDEPNLPQVLKDLTAANNAVHAAAPDVWMGIAYHVQSPEGYELMKTLDVHHLKAFLPPKDFIEARKHAKFMLNCNVGSTRLAYGMKEWRATQEKQTDGCITFSYTGSHVDIYYGLDAREDDYSQAPPRLDGSRATTAQWERIREGIDDYRYALALQQRANDPQSPADVIAQAKALLQQAFDLGGEGKPAEPDKAVNDWRRQAQQLLARP